MTQIWNLETTNRVLKTESIIQFFSNLIVKEAHKMINKCKDVKMLPLTGKMKMPPTVYYVMFGGRKLYMVDLESILKRFPG